MAVMQPKAVSEPPGLETIEELFAALESPLLGYARRMTGDLEVAQDLVQDAFMKLHAQFDEVREPRPWLYRAVHNAALNHRRQAGKIVPLEPPADPQPLPDEKIAQQEGLGLVRLSLETLDDRSRELVRLKFNEGMSYKEISAKTGLTVGNVGYLLHHALKAIGDELARNGVVP